MMRIPWTLRLLPTGIKVTQLNKFLEVTTNYHNV